MSPDAGEKTPEAAGGTRRRRKEAAHQATDNDVQWEVPGNGREKGPLGRAPATSFEDSPSLFRPHLGSWPRTSRDSSSPPSPGCSAFPFQIRPLDSGLRPKGNEVLGDGRRPGASVSPKPPPGEAELTGEKRGHFSQSHGSP